MAEEQKRVSILYHGLIRGFKFDHVRQSHIDYLYTPLKEYGYVIDFFVHTFDKEFDTIIESVYPKCMKIESDSDIHQKVLPISKNYVLPSYFDPTIKINYFKDMYTRKRVFEIFSDYVESTKKRYDWIILVNPGQKFVKPLPNIQMLDNSQVYIPNHSHWTGYCSRFVLGGKDSIKVVCSLYDELEKNKDSPVYMSNKDHDVFNKNGRVNLHPENSVKYILNKHSYFPLEKGNVLDFEVIRVRVDGTIVKN